MAPHRTISTMRQLHLIILCLVGLAGLCSAQSISLSVKTGPPTSHTSVSGTGFPASAAIDIYFQTTQVALTVTNASGSFTGVNIQVPASALPGVDWITAVVQNGSQAAQAPFRVHTNWVQYNANPAHTGTNPLENVISTSNVGTLHEVWTFATGSFITSSPAVANGVLYIGSFDHNVYALNARTGRKIWQYTTGSAIEHSTPAVYRGVVYIGSDDGNVYALNAATGALLWNFTTGAAVHSSPTVVNGVVYIGSEDFSVYALNASTGASIWTFNGAFGPIDSSPAVANGVVYVGTGNPGIDLFDFNVYALNASTGAELWSYTTQDYVDPSPAVANGVVYVADDFHDLYALNASSGSVIWQFAPDGQVAAGPAVAYGKVYVGTAGLGFSTFGVNVSSGTSAWQYFSGAEMESGPSVANGVVYSAGYENGTIYAFDSNSGAVLWQFATIPNGIESNPAIADGMLFIGCATKVCAFAPTGPTAPQRPDPAALRSGLVQN